MLAKRDEIQSVLAKGLEGETSMETLYHTVTAMANLGLECECGGGREGGKEGGRGCM